MLNTIQLVLFLEEDKEEYMVVEYNKRAFLVPIILLAIGVILIFYAPTLQLTVLGGLLALVGVLSLMVLSFAFSQIKMIEGVITSRENPSEEKSEEKNEENKEK